MTWSEIAEDGYRHHIPALEHPVEFTPEDYYPQVSFHRDLGRFVEFIDFNYESYMANMQDRFATMHSVPYGEIQFVPEFEHELVGKAAGTCRDLGNGRSEMKIAVTPSSTNDFLNATLAHESEHFLANYHGEIVDSDREVWDAQEILRGLENDELFTEAKQAIHAARLAIYTCSQYERNARKAAENPAEVVDYRPKQEVVGTVATEEPVEAYGSSPRSPFSLGLQKLIGATMLVLAVPAGSYVTKHMESGDGGPLSRPKIEHVLHVNVDNPSIRNIVMDKKHIKIELPKNSLPHKPRQVGHPELPKPQP